ncbi:TPA: restriction endonuclease subunit S [Klebsiella pneumoniae]|uniref:restriction endonuclease subunit S n=1 Tax=Klebsiella pneumoniae TaxID=573 RepID=UPI000D6556C7|nr:restriction endonuclease subunit S [Klebsiella pneumoniae]EIX9777088.1 restriction endonuclease subunit S [Klebsiella pneumoniae]MBW6007243.1 restriction endonuclease subunit S [Klebsiella pneumoniae]MCQ8417621.1 restriction endonuclease subunit S [Klebsiella pneumoniae]PWS18595.1 restriction endonuclease subunit S [Klebsiella pneumoniae]RBI73892.1 restriction endonuclease subunit S [Klebsiella pneumoniae]
MAKYKAYPEYKDSGVEWLGEVPNHWKTVSISRLFSRVKRTGYTEKELLSVYRDYGVIPKSSRDDNNNKPSEDLSPYQLVEPNDLVMNKMKAWQGSIAISEYEGIVSPAYFVYKPNNVLFELAHPRYVHYLLRNPIYVTQYLSRSKGIRVNQWDLDPDEFRNIELLLPDKTEQEKIYCFLDHETAKIDDLIAKQQQLIELLKEKRQAVISQAVTKGLNPDVPMKDSGVEWLGEIPSHWEMKRLAYLGSARNGLTYSPENITDQESGVLVLRSSNIQNSSLCFDDNVYVNSIIPEQFLVKENDLIICSRNGSRNLIGKNALISKDAEGMAFGAFMAIFRSPLNTYIFWVLNSPLFDYQSGSFLTSTINQLTIGNLNSMEIPVPTLKEQKEIAQYLSRKNDNFIALINRVKDSIALLQERRTALISAAVTGKIDVRDWVAPDTQDVEESQEATA